MKLKRYLSGLLAAVMLAVLPILPASAAQSAAFTDIPDAATAEAAEVLRLLGVVNGVGGTSFQPGGTLSRAQFCKMTVEIMGRGDEEPAQRSRTIFTDVSSTHWARGYVNLAASITLGESEESGSATRLIMGVGNGAFEPERNITYGEAVTILMRVLGYGTLDTSSGSTWYEGYLAAADQAGLTDGLSLTGNAVMNRGQAAILFYNLLFTKSKGSTEPYLTKLDCVRETGGIVLDINATAPDGTGGAVKTTTGTYKTERSPFSSSLEGTQGDLLLDQDGKLLAFLPADNVSSRAESISEWAYNYVLTADKTKLEIPPEAIIYQNGEDKTYGDVWLEMKKDTSVTIYYTSAGKVSYLFLGGSSARDSEQVMVAKRNGSASLNPFAALAGGGVNYQIYKNGVAASSADIRQYDVATYDSTSKIMHVSDFRLSGIYENVYPNAQTPTQVTLLGTTFPLLDSAAADLSAFQLGDAITLLFTTDGQVAGVTAQSAVSSTAIGIVSKIDTNGYAEITLLNDLVGPLSGKTSRTGTLASQLLGELVAVSSTKAGELAIREMSKNTATAGIDITAGTMGTIPLAKNVILYDRVGKGAPKRIALEDITRDTIAASEIVYYAKDYAGNIGVLILNDVTGDAYTYGRLTYTPAKATSDEDADNATVSVTNSSGTVGPVVCAVSLKTDTYAGIAFTADGSKFAGSVSLTQLTGVRRSDFDMNAETVTVGGLTFPISPAVECYNKTAKVWFGGEETTMVDTVNQIRSFSDNLTVYYDKAPDRGGKIRLIVAE